MSPALAFREMQEVDPRALWLAERRKGIGGSDAPAVLGVSPYRTALDVYREKLGEGDEPQPDNESMLWGRVLEPVIRQQYAERTGRVVRLPTGIVRHPQHQHMLATLDGVTDDGRLVEVKTARTGQGWGDPGTDEIPQPYLVQVQHYLCVTGFEVADVAVLIGGADFRLYQVEPDRELQEMLIEAEQEFWRRVQHREPPEPRTYAEVVQRFGRSDASGTVVADADTAAAAYHLAHLREQIKALEAEEETAKAELLRALGERGDTLIDQHGATLATWKLAKAPQRFDAKRFAAEHPDLHQQFVAEGTPSRRLLLKI